MEKAVPWGAFRNWLTLIKSVIFCFVCCFLKGQREFGLSSDSDAVAHFEVIEFSDGVHLANAVKTNAVDLTDGVE